MPTEMQRKASREYENRMDTVKFRVRKGKRQAIKALAKSYGLTVNETLNYLVDVAMEKNNIKWKPADPDDKQI